MKQVEFVKSCGVNNVKSCELKSLKFVKLLRFNGHGPVRSVSLQLSAKNNNRLSRVFVSLLRSGIKPVLSDNITLLAGDVRIDNEANI